MRGGAATATGTGHAASGSISARADSLASTSANLIQEVFARADGNVSGAGTAAAFVEYGGAVPAFTTANVAVAQGSGLPTTAAVNAVLNANPNIKAGFGPKQTYFGIAEIGGGHASTGTDSQTTFSEFYVAVNTAALAKAGDLKIGFYGGQAIGNGVTGVTVNVTENGNALLPPTSFTSGAAAAAFFNDNAIDLGAIAKGVVLDLAVTISVTSDVAGSGFYGNFILGDPASALAAAHADLLRALELPHNGHFYLDRY